MAKREFAKIGRTQRRVLPDLLVVVGSGEDEKKYRCNSVTMAIHSKYIDAMLSTAMTESQTMTITFPDISTGSWKKDQVS